MVAPLGWPAPLQVYQDDAGAVSIGQPLGHFFRAGGRLSAGHPRSDDVMPLFRMLGGRIVGVSRNSPVRSALTRSNSARKRLTRSSARSGFGSRAAHRRAIGIAPIAMQLPLSL